MVDLGVPGVVLNASTYAGGGQRYLLASEETPGAAVLIDLEAGTASTVADGAFSGAVSADERWAVVLTVDGLVLAPTDDAALATTLDESVVTLAVGPDDRAAWSVREGDAYDVHLGTITADGELSGEAVATTGSPGGLALGGRHAAHRRRRDRAQPGGRLGGGGDRRRAHRFQRALRARAGRAGRGRLDTTSST